VKALFHVLVSITSAYLSWCHSASGLAGVDMTMLCACSYLMNRIRVHLIPR